MSDGKIFITISDQRGQAPQQPSGSSQPTSQQPINTNDKSKSKGVGSNVIAHQFLHFAENQAKQFIDYSISNIGNFQGDFQTQREIQNAMSVGRTLIGIGTAFATGGIVGGLIATAGVGINMAYQYHTGQVMTNQQNYSIEQLKKLSGLSSLTNGSR